MEGVVVLSNKSVYSLPLSRASALHADGPDVSSKPLLTTRFSNPRLADLSIDAFLNAKRSRTSSSHAITYNDVDAYDTVTSGSSSNGKSRDDVIDPIIWFEAFEDLSRRRGHASTSQNGGMGKGKGKARGRLNSYTVSDDEDEETDSEEEEDSEDDDDDEDEDVATGNAWASTSSARTDEKTNGSTKTSSKIGTSYGCCHISHNNLSFLVPVRRDCECGSCFCRVRTSAAIGQADALLLSCSICTVAHRRSVNSFLVPILADRRPTPISRRRSERHIAKGELRCNASTARRDL